MVKLTLSHAISFLCGHHSRCGASSILQDVPHEILIEIVKLALGLEVETVTKHRCYSNCYCFVYSQAFLNWIQIQNS